MILGHDGCKGWLMKILVWEFMPTGFDPMTSVYLCDILMSSVHKIMLTYYVEVLWWYTIWINVFCVLNIQFDTYEWELFMFSFDYLNYITSYH